ncbi:hypothetical protein [Virgisporangium aurantiacum]|uniref:Uncharacterized protein n=1 Tax=Virgisporangium aurantiacum TaxID=175570 RepID=A0A8J3ZL95_9ACTN|nr:hypothetical protein [Virgisporangium aurantiacum]GIJ64080.1 hypothetical protein Vau01_115960 [Virgisporangium aurantiacum]
MRHIARRTGLRKSTISDWFNYRSFPQYETFSVFLSYFDDEAWRRDLAIMWQAAWEAHQAARSAAPARPRDHPGPPPSATQRRPRWRRPAAAGVALLVLMLAAYAVVRTTGLIGGNDALARPADSTAPAVGIVGGTCMVVTARDVRVFTSASADEPWTTWARGTSFWVDRDAGSTSRYRTTLGNGRHGWVTTDHRYVQPATTCV